VKEKNLMGKKDRGYKDTKRVKKKKQTGAGTQLQIRETYALAQGWERGSKNIIKAVKKQRSWAGTGSAVEKYRQLG